MLLGAKVHREDSMVRRWIAGVFGLCVFGFALALVLRNLATVNLDYLFGRLSVPLAAILVIALIVGMMIGFLAALPAILRKRRQLRLIQRKLAHAEQEVSNLRRIPLRDDH